MLLTLAEEIGFSHAAKLDPASLTVHEQVRQLCAADRCGSYGRNWSCPPFAGETETLRRRLAGYDSGILVASVGELEDALDVEGMGQLMLRHRRRFDTLIRQAKLLYPKVLPLSAGPCTVCRVCTCPDRPCRFPGKQLSSMEAYGLMVSDICRACGVPYSSGSSTMTYLSCVLTAGEPQ